MMSRDRLSERGDRRPDSEQGTQGDKYLDGGVPDWQNASRVSRASDALKTEYIFS